MFGQRATRNDVRSNFGGGSQTPRGSGVHQKLPPGCAPSKVHSTISQLAEASQVKAKQGKARQCKVNQRQSKQSKARQGKYKQSKARQIRAYQSKARQGKVHSTISQLAEAEAVRVESFQEEGEVG